MHTQTQAMLVADRERIVARYLGFWIGLFTAFIALIGFTIAFLTPPRSGPFCAGNCVQYPYTNTTAFFPRDYWWVIPSILLTPLFMILCACVHSCSASEHKIFSRIALMFAAIATGMVTLDYFIQWEVIQPSLLRNETDGIGLLSQYNPHGIFIAMEDLGYLMMSAAFFFLGASLVADSRLARTIRWVLMGSAVLGVTTFIGMSLLYRNRLETRFELAIISINWAALAAASIMLSFLFAQRRKHPAS